MHTCMLCYVSLLFSSISLPFIIRFIMYRGISWAFQLFLCRGWMYDWWWWWWWWWPLQHFSAFLVYCYESPWEAFPLFSSPIYRFCFRSRVVGTARQQLAEQGTEAGKACMAGHYILSLRKEAIDIYTCWKLFLLQCLIYTAFHTHFI